jgi:hypothetical protein
MNNLQIEIIQLTLDAARARKLGNPLLAEIFLALRVLWIAEVQRLKTLEKAA